MPLNSKTKAGREGFTLIELLIVVAIIGVLAAIAVPQYSKYRKSAKNSSAKTACHNVAVAQEAHFIASSSYTTDYSALIEIGGLDIDNSILYGPISLVVTTDPPTFAFTANHKDDGTETYIYDTAAVTTMVAGGTRVTVNDPSVP
jgi:prepilin-type N-terminal cleavage/methylation domain-containing protein